MRVCRCQLLSSLGRVTQRGLYFVNYLLFRLHQVLVLITLVLCLPRLPGVIRK